jgi:2'-5' RNA ligase
MITIASLLDNKANKKIEKYWMLLERDCLLSEIKTTPFPHFSWFTAMVGENSAIEEKLEEIGRQLIPLTVQTGGLGIFTGIKPILYLPLIKTRELLSSHELIWFGFQSIVSGTNKHYAPDSWIPHITLAYGDVSTRRLSCAIQNLSVIDLSMNIQIDNIAFLSRIDEEPRIEFVIPLTEQTEM